MKYSKLLENLESKNSKTINFRRYSLSEILSESYRTYYNSQSGSNMHKLLEEHINDVRRNPRDVDRLSRQLSIIKFISESKDIEDGELLVPEECYDTVEPKEKKVDEGRSWSLDWKDEKREKIKCYSFSDDEIIGKIYAPHPAAGFDTYGAQIVDNSKDEIIADEEFDDEDSAKAWVEAWFDENLSESAHDEDVEEKEDEDLLEAIAGFTWGAWQREKGNPSRVKYFSSDDVNILGVIYEPTSSDAKYSAEIYDNESVETLEDKVNEFSTEEDAMAWVEKWFKDNGPKGLSEANDEEEPELTEDEVKELTKHLAELRKKNKTMTECDDNPVTESTTKARKLVRRNESKVVTESKSWKDISLTEFAKKSSGKAFFKTFNKMNGKLAEGTALTRQESISLYKAANSAMTHLSVELEHNPEFLATFKESVNLLSVDVNKLLLSLTEGKAPSKATMKSLSKFVESLLREDTEEEDIPAIEDEEEAYIDPEMDTEGALEIEELSPEAEEYLQDYADAYVEAREEMHEEMEEKYGESEDPQVQEMLAHDAEEVEQMVEQQSEEEEEAPAEEANPAEDEDAPVEEEGAEESEETEEVEESVEDEEITDDELAQLKKFLTEMRKNNKK